MWRSHSIGDWTSPWCSSSQACVWVNNLLLKYAMLLQSIPTYILHHFLDNPRLCSWRCHSNYSLALKISSNILFQVHIHHISFYLLLFDNIIDLCISFHIANKFHSLLPLYIWYLEKLGKYGWINIPVSSESRGARMDLNIIFWFYQCL